MKGLMSTASTHSWSVPYTCQPSETTEANASTPNSRTNRRHSSFLHVQAYLYVGCLRGAAARIVTAESSCAVATWQVVDEGAYVYCLHSPPIFC
jgi:hypothetical protein